MDPLKTSPSTLSAQPVQRTAPAASARQIQLQGLQRVQVAPVASQTDQLKTGRVQGGQASQSLAFIENSPPPSPEDLRWALQLEQKVQQGYSPNAAEKDRYQDIALRLQATPIHQGTPTPGATPPSRPSSTDIQQALNLEARVQQGYQPTAQELSQYQQVFNALHQADQVAVLPGLSADESQWALTLQHKIQQGYQASSMEVQRYTQLYQRMQQATPSATPPSTQELDWAQQLSQRISQGYRPTQPEMQAYTAIYERYQTQQTPQPGTRHLSSDELNWALQLRQNVSQGYQPNTQEIARYTDIMRCLERHSPPIADPSKQSLGQYEMDWAITLQERVSQGYTPKAEEYARYQEIYQRLTP